MDTIDRQYQFGRWVDMINNPEKYWNKNIEHQVKTMEDDYQAHRHPRLAPGFNIPNDLDANHNVHGRQYNDIMKEKKRIAANKANLTRRQQK